VKNDLVLWIYSLTALVSLYGFCLFAWWWKKRGRASAVYGYVTFILLGITLYNTGSGYVRWYRYTDHDHYMDLMGTWWWTGRLWIILLSVLAIVIHMSYRVFWQRHRLKEKIETIEMQTTSECRQEIGAKIDEVNERLTDIEAVLKARKNGFKQLLDDIP